MTISSLAVRPAYPTSAVSLRGASLSPCHPSRLRTGDRSASSWGVWGKRGSLLGSIESGTKAKATCCLLFRFRKISNNLSSHFRNVVFLYFLSTSKRCRVAQALLRLESTHEEAEESRPSNRPGCCTGTDRLCQRPQFRRRSETALRPRRNLHRVLTGSVRGGLLYKVARHV